MGLRKNILFSTVKIKCNVESIERNERKNNKQSHRTIKAQKHRQEKESHAKTRKIR